MKRTSRVVLAAALMVALSASASCAHPATPLHPVPEASHTVTKLLVVVEENHSLSQMKQEMPYTFSLAKAYGYANNYIAITHPSLPNYLAIASGSAHGISDDQDPATHPLRGRSVFGQAILHSRTAAVYAEGMDVPCALRDTGSYVVRHNPWSYFVRERALCLDHEFPMRRFTSDAADGALPRVGMVIPDLDHDAHDGSLADADAWFESVMTQVFAGPDWLSGHLAVVLTADEDDRVHGNSVLTVVIHPSQQHRVVTQRLDHYALTRLYEDVAKVPHLAKARTAAAMSDAFDLPVP